MGSFYRIRWRDFGEADSGPKGIRYLFLLDTDCMQVSLRQDFRHGEKFKRLTRVLVREFKTAPP
jgi:hypothetical protein